MKLSIEKQKAAGVKVFSVSYTRKVGGTGTVLVKAVNEANALSNAKSSVFTGKDFRHAVVIGEADSPLYTTPPKQGFQGSQRA